MVQKKVFVLLDYVKDHYIGYHKNGEIFNRFDKTNDGIYLKSMVGIGLKEKNYGGSFDMKVGFAYPQVPNIIRENKRDKELTIYQPPTYPQVKENLPNIQDRIKEYNPDVIIVAGTLAAKMLTGIGTISQLRSKSSTIKLDDKEYTVLATYSPSYVLSNPDSKRLANLDFELVAEYVINGEDAFSKKKTKYTTLYNTDVDKIIKVLDLAIEYAKTPDKAVAWDYETNSLSGTAPTSKILTLSISFEPESGITFPIDHPSSPLSPKDRELVINKLKEFFTASIYKVGHNVAFDMLQTKLLFGPVTFKKTIDTMLGFYILVSQDSKVVKGLKELANQYTDMGGYDEPLDDYKSWFILGFTSVRGKRLKEKFEKTFVDKVYRSLTEDYELTDDDYLDYLTPEQREVAYNWAVYLLDKFKEPGLIRNEQDLNDKFDYSWIPYDVLANYASGDVDATKRIHARFIKEASKDGALYNLYTSHYPSLLNTLTNIEATGVSLDIDYLKDVADVFDKKLASLYEEMMASPEVQATIDYKADLYRQGLEEKMKPTKERDKNIYKYYTQYKNAEDREFSPTKKIDLHYAFFGNKDHWLPVDSKYVTDSFMKKLRNKQVLEEDITFMDFATGSDVVDELIKRHPDFEFAKLYQTYGRLNKLRSTYTYSLIEKADRFGQVHGKYLAHGTNTTRLSSQNPNMQNISKPTNNPSAFDYKYPIKNAFIPNASKGQDTIVNLDFSSQEAHLAAVVAHDEDMIDAFLKGKDVHSETAALMYGIPSSDVTRDQRQAAKSTTFGLMYGKTPIGYAESEGITQPEAEEIFRKYFESKPKIKQAIDRAQQEVRKNGSIRIPASGFIRKLGDIYSNQYSKQQSSLRESFNTVIQGSSAFLTQLALIGIDTYLQQSDINADIIITVHDSITLSVAHDDVDKAITASKYIMEHIPLPMLYIEHGGKQILFPMEASADIGATYGYEFEYEKEDFFSFNSTKGFTEYYKQVKLLEDKEDAKLITKDEYDLELKNLENRKFEYQVI